MAAAEREGELILRCGQRRAAGQVDGGLELLGELTCDGHVDRVKTARADEMDPRMGMATGQDSHLGAIQAHVTLFDEGDHLLVQGYALARIEIVFARGT